MLAEMTCRRTYRALVASFIVVAAPAIAECTGEAAAYEAARASFAEDVTAIYHVPVSAPDFASRDTSGDDDLAAKRMKINGIDYAALSEITKSSRQLHHEVTQMADVVIAAVNPLFLKRRKMPPAFYAGAELSRCYAQLELAQVQRIGAVLEEESAKAEARRAEHQAARGGDVGSYVEHSQPEPYAPELLGDMEFEGEVMGEAMAMLFGVAVTVGFTMGERDNLESKIALRFGEELDFGYWDMNEEAE